ncbi:MAG: flagellar basal body P-ring formation protein FlgA [Deltaproteobacteria bacterium]|nr:flagellar basal body P-ring formation protein FlgA [Deltaproteobacteria bacterium]
MKTLGRDKTNMIMKRSWLALILLGLIPSTHALDIKIHEQATVSTNAISLKDIATFTPADDERILRLRDARIASAPPPGKIFRIHDRFLIRELDSTIATIPDNQDIHVKIPDSLLVKRTAQVMTPEQLKEIYKEYIFSHSPWPANQIIFERINDPGNVTLPTGELHWEVHERKNHQFIGNMSITVNLWVDGVLIRKVPVSGCIMIKQQVIKAAKDIKAGRMISGQDLVRGAENHSRHQDDMVADLNDVIGKRSVGSIQAGQRITFNMIETPPHVEKGSQVMIRAENKDIRIMTPGRVLEDGRVGDQIRVVNISSGKEIFATVAGPGLVEVYF